MKNNTENKKVVCRLDNLNLSPEVYAIVKAQAKALHLPVKQFLQLVLEKVIPTLEIEVKSKTKIEIGEE